MTTFVLVHGAWAGAHGWRAVRKLLAAEGHEVFTPSLTGIGERVHLASPQVDLTTHVNDVVNQIVFEDLRDIVLVGYSYGGVVVTGSRRARPRPRARARVPRRVRAVRRRLRLRRARCRAARR